jgi:phosphatidylserine decarboxylase
MRFAREAWPFVAPFPALAALLLAAGKRRSAAAALAAGGAVLLFFRDPQRRYVGDPRAILAAADGVVTLVDRVEDADLGPGTFHRVVTFLSALDVHVQRVPTSGVVVTSRYRPGRKVAAFLAHADTVNQSHLTVIERPDGDRLGVRQIAGLVARRVVCYLAPGQPVQQGQLMGIIKFGSRVDLLVPESYEVLVEKGDRLRNGESPVALPPGEAS